MDERRKEVTNVRPAEHEFLRFLGMAREAAELRRAADMEYALTQAHEQAIYLGWASTRERLLECQNECLVMLRRGND